MKNTYHRLRPIMMATYMGLFIVGLGSVSSSMDCKTTPTKTTTVKCATPKLTAPKKQASIPLKNPLQMIIARFM